MILNNNLPLQYIQNEKSNILSSQNESLVTVEIPHCLSLASIIPIILGNLKWVSKTVIYLCSHKKVLELELKSGKPQF